MTFFESMRLRMLTGLVLVLCLQQSYAQSYKAGVVAYQVQYDPQDLPSQLETRNKESHVHLVADLKDQDIVIFPEHGITTLKPNALLRSHLDAYSIYVPDPLTINFSSNILSGISSAAMSYKTYVVTNVLEKTMSPEKYYSTDVVFDSEGKLIAKCRKRYLNQEKSYDKGESNQTCIFEAKFKRINVTVKFALLFDTDLLEPVPDKTIQHVILTSSMPIGLPLSFGLSLQTGYAIRNGVNLLASGYTDSSKGYAGTGIYFRNGTSRVTLNSDSFLFDDVPIDQNRATDVKVVSSTKLNTLEKKVYEQIPTLESSDKITFLRLKDHGGSCNLTMVLNGNDIQPYRWVAFSSNRTLLGQHKKVIICGLIKPEGSMNENRIINDAIISVTANHKDISQVLPLSLAGSKFVPANFQFKEENNGDLTTVKLKLTQQEDLLAFGVLLVIKDDASHSSSIHLSRMSLVGLLPILAFLWSKYNI